MNSSGFFWCLTHLYPPTLVILAWKQYKCEQGRVDCSDSFFFQDRGVQLQQKKQKKQFSPLGLSEAGTGATGIRTQESTGR